MKASAVAGAVAPFTLLVLLVAGCDAGRVFPRLRTSIVGENRAVGEGSIRSWVQLDRQGRPLAVGITFSESALSALPPAPHAALTLALPPEAAGTAFDHIEVAWTAGGDQPDDLFSTPHLGVHFYLLTPAERDAISDPQRAARIPALALIPQSYVPIPRLLPRAGAHWIDPSAPEFNGEDLLHTLLYGFYDGQLVFLDAKLARAFLETRPRLTQELKLPRRYARPGYYPTRYSVHYDASAREYTLALEGLVLRQ